ncbi:MAG: hypothetical protein C0507_14010 [Cyanobacteria bacterium PR.3.49]|nr:hypothetical protein [Cyanobacteria bacterium PR.3.49]
MTIEEVLERLEQIDNSLPDNDGFKWFTRLYKVVTERIVQEPKDTWQSPEWLERLDVIFAGLFFEALERDANGLEIPSSLEALFESRKKKHVDRIQFALAGMNAHINRDLYYALEEVNAEFDISPDTADAVHADYLKVNDILEDVFPDALAFLHTGVLGCAAEYSGIIGELLGMWAVRKARDSAWGWWEALYDKSDAEKWTASVLNDGMTGVAGRALLSPFSLGALKS